MRPGLPTCRLAWVQASGPHLWISCARQGPKILDTTQKREFFINKIQWHRGVTEGRYARFLSQIETVSQFRPRRIRAADSDVKANCNVGARVLARAEKIPGPGIDTFRLAITYEEARCGAALRLHGRGRPRPHYLRGRKGGVCRRSSHSRCIKVRTFVFQYIEQKETRIAWHRCYCKVWLVVVSPWPPML